MGKGSSSPCVLGADWAAAVLAVGLVWAEPGAGDQTLVLGKGEERESQVSLAEAETGRV